jgi:hypothetical protein
MTERVLPTPEKFASCPYEGKILEFYEGQFESVFSLLHPFFKPISIDSELFYPETWPSKNEIIEGCEIIKWQEVLQLTRLETISEIDIGLKTSILALKESKCNHEYADILKKLTKDEDIIHPPEGDLPPLLENRIYSALKNIGYKWLWVGDEFGTERQLHWIDDLMAKEQIPAHGCVFTHDHNVLVATHWDSHCSFLCSSKETIEMILEFDDFEGFYCTPKTEVYWGLYEI